MRFLPARSKKDHGGTGEGKDRAEDIPVIRRALLDEPEPDKGRKDIDPAIGGVGAAGMIGRRKGKEPGEGHQAENARDKPEHGFAETKGCPEGKAPSDFGQRCESVNEERGQGGQQGLAPRAAADGAETLGKALAHGFMRRGEAHEDGELVGS